MAFSCLLSCKLFCLPWWLGNLHFHREQRRTARVSASCCRVDAPVIMLICPNTFEPLKMGRLCIEVPVIPKWLKELYQSQCLSLWKSSRQSFVCAGASWSSCRDDIEFSQQWEAGSSSCLCLMLPTLIMLMSRLWQVILFTGEQMTWASLSWKNTLLLFFEEQYAFWRHAANRQQQPCLLITEESKTFSSAAVCQKIRRLCTCQSGLFWLNAWCV